MNSITTQVRVYPGTETQTCEVFYLEEREAVEIVSVVVVADFPEGEEDESNHLDSLSMETILRLEHEVYDHVVDTDADHREG